MATTSNGSLTKGLGLVDSTTLVMGSMIGSGIFIVAADISRQVQSPGLLMMTWFVTAILTLIAALSYGELAAAMPHAGGQYVYLREAFGPLYGFLYGWTLFMVIQTGTIAAVAVAFAKYAGVFFPWISDQNYLLGAGKIGVSHAATRGDCDHRLPHVEQHARHPHRRHGAERLHRGQGRGDSRTDRRGLPGGPQSRGRGQQLRRILAQRGLELHHRRGWSVWRWSARCSAATPGTTSRSPPAKCAIRGATCRSRSPSASASSARSTSFRNFVYLNVLTFDAIQHAAEGSGRGRRGRANAGTGRRCRSWPPPSWSPPSAASTV